MRYPELVGGVCRNVDGNRLRGAEGIVERLRPARGAAPFQLWHRLRDRGRSDGGRCGETDACGFEKLSTFHGASLFTSLCSGSWPAKSRAFLLPANPVYRRMPV